MPTSDGRIKVMALVPSMRTGGAERVISLLLQQLDREQFAPELTIVYDSDIAYAIPEDVPVTVLENEPATEARARQIALPESLRARYSGSADWLSSVAAKLAVHVGERSPDIIVSSPLWASILAVVAHDDLPVSTRLVNRVDAPPSVSLAQSDLKDLFVHLMQASFNKSDQVIAVSKAVGRDLVENFGVNAERIQVVNNPIDIPRIQALAEETVEEPWFDDGVPTVVFVGRLERVKGLKYLVRAVARMLPQRPVRLVLVGDGTHRGFLKALTRHLGIEDSVVFAGRKSNPFKYLRRGTVFVLPSLSEGMPNVLLEAMACGCPVVATDIQGGIVREILQDGECGLIVPREDDVALAEALLRLIEDDACCAELRQRGLLRAEEFDLPGIMAQNQQLILDVAQRPTSRLQSQQIAAPLGSSSRKRLTATGGPEVSGTSDPEHRTARSIPKLASRAARKLQKFVLTNLIGSRTDGRIRQGQAKQVFDERSSGRLRLMVLVPSMDDEFMGAGIRVLLRELDRSRFDVCLAQILSSGEVEAVPKDVAQLTVVPDSDRRDLPLDLEGLGERYADELAWMRACARGLVNLSQKRLPDAILAQGFYASLVLTMAKAELPVSVASVAAMHSRAHDFASVTGFGELYSSLLRKYLPMADAVIASSESIASELVSAFGVSEERVSQIPDPVEVGSAETYSSYVDNAGIERTCSGRPFVCFLGGDPSSACNVLCEALRLAREDEPVSVALAVPPDRMDEVRECAEQHGLGNGLEVLPPDDVVSHVPHASGVVHVASSAGTGLPNEIVEATAFGVPVISTRTSDAISEFLGEGERGILVPRNDPEALAESMLQLLWDSECGQDLALSAQQYLREVAGQTVLPRLEDLVAKTVELRAPTRTSHRRTDAYAVTRTQPSAALGGPEAEDER